MGGSSLKRNISSQLLHTLHEVIWIKFDALNIQYICMMLYTLKHGDITLPTLRRR